MKLATRLAILSTVFQFLPLVFASFNKKLQKFDTVSEFDWQNHNEAKKPRHSNGVGNSHESDPYTRWQWHHNSQSYSHLQPNVGNNPYSYSDLHGPADHQSQAYGTSAQGNQPMLDDGSALLDLPSSFNPMFGSGPYPPSGIIGYTSEHPTGSSFHVDNVNMAQLENTFAIPTHTTHYNAVPLYTKISGPPDHAYGNLNPTGPAHQSHGYGAYAQGDQQMYHVRSFETSPLPISSSQFSHPDISPQELLRSMENNLAGSSSNGGYNMNHQLATRLAHDTVSPCEEKSKVFDVTSSLEDFGQITKLMFPKTPRSPNILTLVTNQELAKYTRRVSHRRRVLEYSKNNYRSPNGLLREICHRNCAFLLLFRVPEEPSISNEINNMVKSKPDLETQRNLLVWSVTRLRKALEEIRMGKQLPEKLPTSTLDNYILKYFQEEINENGSKEVETKFCKSHIIYTQRNTQAELLKTQVAVHMLGEYYKSENSDKWKLIFTKDESFIRLFAKLGQDELCTGKLKGMTIFNSVGGIVGLNIFPWSDLPTFTMEDFETKYNDLYSMING